MIDILKNVSIMGVACAVPESIKYTESYKEQIGEEAVDKFISTIGIKERHITDEEKDITASDLCYVAAEKLLSVLKIDKESIDCLIFVTQHPDYPTSPATACVLQYRLGLSEQCMAYDVNQGCTGYLYGLHIAASHLQSGKIRKVLLLVGDAGHRISPQDKSVSMLFGDAGSATLLQYKENANEIHYIMKTIGSGFRTIITPCGGARHRKGDSVRRYRSEGIVRSDFDGFMDGTEVFNFTIKEVPKLFKEFYEKFDDESKEKDIYFFHQANLYMIKYIAKKVKLPWDKIPISLDRYGNTSSASIPVTLCDAFSGQNLIDKRVMMCAFGVGLSLGIITLKMGDCKILPIITTSESFEDGVL